MKKISNVLKSVFAAMLACVVVFSAFSCEKNGEVTPDNEIGMQEGEGTLIVSIATQKEAWTKASADENGVNIIELFVFRNEGTGSGDLDAYKKLEGGENVSLSNVEIKSTTGKKLVYAVLNSHGADWTGVKTLADFRKKLVCLKDEKPGDFTMVGSAEATLQLTTNVPIEVSRLVAKVQLSSIRCDFTGTPYEGASLTDVKAYLINASACKTFVLNTNAETPHVFNDKGFSSADIISCADGSILYKDLGSSINATALNVGHNFYCFENTIEQQTETERFTRLVIEGKLNGHKYYYPININREGFGYTAENDHKGVKRNTAYSIDVTICRPGSTDPDGILEYGDMSATVTIKDWMTVPQSQVQF